MRSEISKRKISHRRAKLVRGKDTNRTSTNKNSDEIQRAGWGWFNLWSSCRRSPSGTRKRRDDLIEIIHRCLCSARKKGGKGEGDNLNEVNVCETIESPSWGVVDASFFPPNMQIHHYELTFAESSSLWNSSHSLEFIIAHINLLHASSRLDEARSFRYSSSHSFVSLFPFPCTRREHIKFHREAASFEFPRTRLLRC